MRKYESEEVMGNFKEAGLEVHLIEASHTFYNATTTLHLSNNKGKEKKVRLSNLLSIFIKNSLLNCSI